MQELFFAIFNRSILAGWLILAVLVFRSVLKHAPKRFRIWLWGAVGIRLAVPFSIKSMFSLLPSTEVITIERITGQVQTVQDAQAVQVTILDSSWPILSGFSDIWFTGMTVLLLYAVCSYWHLHRSVREAVRLQDNIYQSEHVTNPFVLGIIHPRVYVPFHMEKQVLEHVIAHEQAHIQRKDYLWKLIGFLLLTLYWFHPLMWYSYMLLGRDIEFACDEAVIRKLGNEQKADYTQALVSCSVKGNGLAGYSVAFGETGVRQRIRFIMNYKKPAFRTVLLSVIACIIVMVCFLTEPPQKALVERGNSAGEYHHVLSGSGRVDSTQNYHVQNLSHGNVSREPRVVSEETDTDTVEGTICVKCKNGTMMLKETTYSGWYKAGYQGCLADKRFNDSVQERNVLYLYECDNRQCGLGTGRSAVQTGILCTH